MIISTLMKIDFIYRILMIFRIIWIIINYSYRLYRFNNVDYSINVNSFKLLAKT